MKSPWKSVGEIDSETSYLVLASSIPPKSIASTWKLFRGSMAVRRQLLATDGVIGFSMLAEPFRKHYATLSVWRDEAALDAFARAHPHDQLRADLAPSMGPTRFVRWTISGPMAFHPGPKRSLAWSEHRSTRRVHLRAS